mmetsp:Transcript_57481/g.125892  ORF Transcript_57481/g.125892 Transcript_57481/m.125892 type:complete len:230 (+) Transcript_57481:629-1318(+)
MNSHCSKNGIDRLLSCGTPAAHHLFHRRRRRRQCFHSLHLNAQIQAMHQLRCRGCTHLPSSNIGGVHKLRKSLLRGALLHCRVNLLLLLGRAGLGLPLRPTLLNERLILGRGLDSRAVSRGPFPESWVLPLLVVGLLAAGDATRRRRSLRSRRWSGVLVVLEARTCARLVLLSGRSFLLTLGPSLRNPHIVGHPISSCRLLLLPCWGSLLALGPALGDPLLVGHSVTSS